MQIPYEAIPDRNQEIVIVSHKKDKNEIAQKIAAHIAVEITRGNSRYMLTEILEWKETEHAIRVRVYIMHLEPTENRKGD